ncbi:HD domain-containing phosphohydrolase [Clostridium baratii]|uniref:HD domain-containing phosphohydrolase n=1 Tax=Clostridium baratii TaxID=1561 RepID=UPI001CB32E1F|nr:HD domain-containing phosphohydrolase [Clostridium baratii]STA99953.1 diguanylate cyclase and metal dependent phosphohydrolase [Clostridium baratii]
MNLIDILLENIPFAILIANKDSKVEMVNTKFCEMLHLSKEDILKKHIEYLLDKIYSNENIKFNRDIDLGSKSVKEYSVYDKVVEVHVVKVNNYDSEISSIVTLIDVTWRVGVKKEIIKQKNMLNSIIDAIPESIFFKDVNSKYLGCNLAFEELFDVKREEIIGKGNEVLALSKDEAENFVTKDKEVLETGKCIKVESIHTYKNGKVFLEDIKAPIFGEGNEIIGVVGTSRDITERKKLEDKLTYLSYRDKLTGLYNRTYFDKVSEEYNKNKEDIISIIMGDMNGLKIVNDSLGHLEGDRFIVEISKIIKKVVKDKGEVVRWGGDEIVIILKGTDKDKAIEISEDISNECLLANHKPVPLSISLGVSSGKGKNINELITEAEKEVYKNKLLNDATIRKATINSIKRNIYNNDESKKRIKRMMKLANKIGEEMKLSKNEMDNLRLVVKLHDIGKIGISYEILEKGNNLTKEEIELIKLHTEKGYRILQADKDLSHIASAVLTHHERWDGKGYPLGLAGNSIPFCARVVYLLNAYDYMINGKDEKISEEEAIEVIKKESGKKFDPRLVKVFLRVLNKLKCK